MSQRTNRHYFEEGIQMANYSMMLNITNHQRNANLNQNEILPHTCQNGYHQK